MLAQHLQVAADDRDRRPQLVAGVGDELALQREGLLEPVEHRVEQVAELADLVVGGDDDPARQVVGGLDRARGRAERAQGGEHAADGDVSEHGHDRQHGERDAGGDLHGLGHLGTLVLEIGGDDERAAARAVVADRHRQIARAADVPARDLVDLTQRADALEQL